MTNDRDKKDESAAVNKARQADADRPAAEKDAVATAANVHRDNVNPNAYSEESAREPGDIETYSINEPGPDDPQPFKVPEDHTATTPETLEQAYPDGYVAPETPEQTDQKKQARTVKAADSGSTDDPDDLEDEIDQAKEDGDFKSTHALPHSRKRK